MIDVLPSDKTITLPISKFNVTHTHFISNINRFVYVSFADVMRKLKVFCTMHCM